FWCVLSYFFFQAEDGIRDLTVTGVQTCALPILFSINPSKVKIDSTNTFRIANTSPTAASATTDLNGKAVQIACTAIIERLKPVRSEERRVGKECRSWWRKKE